VETNVKQTADKSDKFTLPEVHELTPAEIQEFPNDKHLTSSEIFQYLVQGRTFRARAADDFGIDFDAAGLFERVKLEIKTLLFGANPGVPLNHRFEEKPVVCRRVQKNDPFSEPILSDSIVALWQGT
jgi:hypothetical protein